MSLQETAPKTTVRAQKKAPAKKAAPKIKIIADEAHKIVLLNRTFDRKEGTKRHKAFLLVQKHKTVESFRAAGGKGGGLKWLVRNKFVKIS